MSGSTIWSRDTLESDIFIWKPDKWFKIWFFLVNRVNFREIKQFKRGECFTTYKEIMACTKATKSQIDQFIRWTKKESMLTTRQTTRGMIVFLPNYAKYQDAVKNKNDKIHEPKTNHKRTINEPIGETFNNENKNIVAKATSIIINNHNYMLEELEYVTDDKPESSNPYGRKIMAVLVRKFCEVAGIMIGIGFNASAWAKPLSQIYRHFNKDAKKTMDYIERSAAYFERKGLEYTPHTLWKNLPLVDKWIAKETKPETKLNPDLYE